jgi:hypothetical protein
MEVNLEELHESLLLLLTSTQDHQGSTPRHPNGVAAGTPRAAGAVSSSQPATPPAAGQALSAKEQQQQGLANGSGAAAAGPMANVSARAKLLSRPVDDFRSCRREWVLKVAKAVAQGFANKAHGK